MDSVNVAHKLIVRPWHVIEMPSIDYGRAEAAYVSLYRHMIKDGVVLAHEQSKNHRGNTYKERLVALKPKGIIIDSRMEDALQGSFQPFFRAPGSDWHIHVYSLDTHVEAAANDVIEALRARS